MVFPGVVMDANAFWNRVDMCNPYKTLKRLTDECGIDYRRVKKNRSDVRLPNTEDVFLLASRAGVSMEFLLTGQNTGHNYSARVCAIADYLMQDQDRLGAVEVLLFGKNAGASMFTKNA
jgi:hypothetical protein